MIGETNINGGTGLNGKGALLKIKSRTGSTITVSKGSYSKIVKTSQLDPDDDNWSYWFFQTTDFGEWTVTATLESDTAVDNVTISENKQYNVFLSFNVYLVKNGVLQSGYSLERGGLNEFSQQSGYVFAKGNNNATGVGTIHISVYSVNYFVLEVNEGTVNSSQYGTDNYGFASSAITASGQTWIAKAAFGNEVIPAGTVKRWTMDVSSLDLSNAYVAINLGYNHYLHIVNLYFSKNTP